MAHYQCPPLHTHDCAEPLLQQAQFGNPTHSGHGKGVHSRITLLYRDVKQSPAGVVMHRASGTRKRVKAASPRRSGFASATSMWIGRPISVCKPHSEELSEEHE